MDKTHVKEKPLAIYKAYLPNTPNNQKTNNHTPHMMLFVYKDDYVSQLTPTDRNGGKKYKETIKYILQHKKNPYTYSL